MTYTLALGPFEMAWRGPQRLVLSIEGERIVETTYRDNASARDVAAQISRLSFGDAVHLVSHSCDTCSHSHAMAFCLALEALAGIQPPERAMALRCVAAELERLASHLGALLRIFGALGLERASRELRAHLEQAHAALTLLCGAESAADVCAPGGVRRDLPDEGRSALLVLLQKLNRTLYRTVDALLDRRPLLRATANVGPLARPAAESFGLRGPIARAAGIAADERLDNPYGFYGSIERRAVTQEGGDVYARLVVLLLEAFESVQMAERALADLPAGPWSTPFPSQLPPGEASASVEAPRGALRYALSAARGRISDVQIDAPRQLDRLLARALLVGARVDDVPLILHSLDVCLTCSEG